MSCQSACKTNHMEVNWLIADLLFYELSFVAFTTNFVKPLTDCFVRENLF